MKFELDPGEQVGQKFRRHWVDMSTAVLMAGGLAAAGIGLSFGTGLYQSIVPMLPHGVLGLISLGLVTLAVIVLLIGFWSYRNNYVVLTNLHIIEVKQTGLFGREISRLTLDHLQDVTGRRVGFWPTILNYGDVLVQTAGETNEFLIQRIPSPQKVAELFQAAHDEYIREHEKEHELL